MGVKGNRNTEIKEKSILTETKIQDVLKHQLSKPRFCLNNLYVFNWESDVLILTQSGYWYEYEIKISRADFRNDFKHKNNKHVHSLSNADHTFKPNYFYYAVPENLISIEEVPEYAGLIYVAEHGSARIIKKAPILHKIKNEPNKMNLADKFYNNMKTAQFKTYEIKRDIKDLNDRYSDLPEMERRSDKNGFDRCYRYSTEAFMKSCPNYSWKEDTHRGTCLKTNESGFGRCRGNCEEIEKFLDIIDIKENGIRN